MEDDEMNCSRYEGDSISLSEITDVGQTLPFFAQKRLILIENSGFFKSANACSIPGFRNDRRLAGRRQGGNKGKRQDLARQQHESFET